MRHSLTTLVVCAAAVLVPGAHLRLPGTTEGSDGWVTSASHSPALGKTIALALLRGGRARVGEKLAVHVAPGASVVQLAAIAVAEATSKVTPAQAPVGRTSTSSSGVRGRGLTSPAAPMTGNVQDAPPACEHCWTIEPPWGSVDGAAPTRRMRRAGVTEG